MPRRNDFQSVLVLGAGPAFIGQGSEFDGAGYQAVLALKTLGYRTVAVSSNPADAMLDSGAADAAYIEPLNASRLAGIIAKEQVDACLPTMGGRAGLKLILELEQAGVLSARPMAVLGGGVHGIAACKDRALLKDALGQTGVDLPESAVALSMEEAEKACGHLGYPVVVRSSHTLGGEGATLVYNSEELRVVAGKGISPGGPVRIIVEQSLLGWEKLQVEVLRDAVGAAVTAGLIENIDPVGIHSGDSMAVVPMLTVAADLMARLREMASAVVGALGIVGVANVQFAHDPHSGRVVVLEVNPRFSRTSALVTAATGLPLAAIATRLAAGFTMHETADDLGLALKDYTPDRDLVAVRLPRFQFERFKGARDRLSTRMQSFGEALGVGGTFKEALQKAVRALDGRSATLSAAGKPGSVDECLEELGEPSSTRLFTLYAALALGAGVDELADKSRIKPWFISQLKDLATLEQAIRARRGRDLAPELLAQAKQDGFSDAEIAGMLGKADDEIREQRKVLGIIKSFQQLPHAQWYYATFHGPTNTAQTPSPTSQGVMILGGGPARIGQGQESDYACAHAARALEAMGHTPIVVNCNPAAVAGFTPLSRMYLEPLAAEDIRDIYLGEEPLGMIFQFGGHTAAAAAGILAGKGVRLLGTPVESISVAADRLRLRARITALGIPMPDSGMASTSDEARTLAEEIGFPVVLRPLKSIDGLGMEIVHDAEMLKTIPNSGPVLISHFLENAVMAEADVVCDGRDVFAPAIMEHVELSGVHAGDCAGVIPPISIPAKHIDLMKSYAERIARDLGIRGLMNVQFAVSGDMLFCLGVSPRASRTVPLVTKACGVELIEMATAVMLSKSLRDYDRQGCGSAGFSVKEVVFPFNAFPDVDPVLGPEMHATGMVMGVSDSFGLAYHKAFEASGVRLPEKGTVLISVSKSERPAVLAVARQFSSLGFDIRATRGTHRFLKAHEIDADVVLKLHEGRPNIVDDIKNHVYGLIINTPNGKLGSHDDSYIRKSAIRFGVPYITTLSGAIAAARGIEAKRQGRG
ncbi:MAG: carbamoyl-phosphate synthase large subunit [Syntrophaceae bacterium]